LGTFSKGLRQRISIGLSLLNSPEVVILDEPTSGLDPRGMAEMRDILKRIRDDRNDLTVLMSSHMMYEVSDLCDRVAVMNHGTLLIHDDLYDVLGHADTRTIIVKTKAEPNQDMLASIEGLANVKSAERKGEDIVVSLKGGKDESSELFRSLASLDIGVYSMSEGQNALEERYLELVKESR
ncbi:MAG: ABC transporter ATP-binding protein, partial [Candidatus Methanomethylophilaceae archaeon]|nr:ABC transporter ATP-binding protein [Candidatus Methanomethylophilaceae archaeon]